MHPGTVTTIFVRVAAVLLLLGAAQCASVQDKCSGTDAKVRHLIMYNLRTGSRQDTRAVTELWRRRQSECGGLVVPQGSYGGPALTTKPTAFGFPATRPLPLNAAVADWVGWMDFNTLDDMRRCLSINNRTGSLAAMRAYAQPNARFDLVLAKNTLPGSKKYGDCPFAGSYAPATVRYVFAYLLPPGVDREATCERGAALWHGILKEADMDVRHGTGCSLLTDAEARAYGMGFNAAFGGYVDFNSMRTMTRYLAARSQSIQAQRVELRSLANFAARAAIALPWSGRR